MLPGPDIVIECPKCEVLARYFTLTSGNTFGARRWTDGKVIAPMSPNPPAITRCRDCGHYYWLSDAKEIGEIPMLEREPVDIPSAWKKAKHVRELSESEYLEAIRTGAASSREQQLHLRICAWWASNDPLRSQEKNAVHRTQTAPPRSVEAIMNLEHLLDLLDIGNPYQRFMRAEALRELGRYDDAIRLLEFDFPSDYESVVALIRSLAQEKDPVVGENLE